MRKNRMCILNLVIVLMLSTTVSAFAAGIPFAVMGTSGTTKIVVVGKFSADSGQFTQTEAQSVTTAVASIIQSYLGAVSISATVFTPNQLSASGAPFNDADDLLAYVKTNYKTWGFSQYAEVDIKKVSEYISGYGQNVRMDIFMNSYYIASLEIPYSYLSLLQSGS